MENNRARWENTCKHHSKERENSIRYIYFNGIKVRYRFSSMIINAKSLFFKPVFKKLRNICIMHVSTAIQKIIGRTLEHSELSVSLRITVMLHDDAET